MSGHRPSDFTRSRLLVGGSLLLCLALAVLTPGRAHADRAHANDGEWHPVVLPEEGRFDPLLADLKQPRIAASYRHLRFRGRGLPAGKQGDEIDAGIVSAGGELPILGLGSRDGREGIGFELLGAILSQFNLSAPSMDLINTDFVAGGQVTGRFGPLSGRFRLFHQSSHLGDEFLLNNPGVDRDNLSFEAADLLLAANGSWWRLYGGGGYVLRSDGDLDPLLVQWGLELRGPRSSREWLGDALAQPVLAADFNAFEERAWQVTSSIEGGVELSGSASTRRFRVLAVYLRGFIPFGQFFNTEKIESIGVELQYAF